MVVLRHPKIVLAAILVAGCTTLQWTKQDVAPHQAGEDLAGCRKQARHEARLWAWEFPGLGYGPGRNSASWPGSPYDDGFFEEARLTRLCMRAKGYQLVPL